MVNLPRFRRRGLLLSLLATTATLSACQRGSRSEQPSGQDPATQTRSSVLLINGAGATFPAPLYLRWFADYRQVDPQLEVNFQPVGSAAGIRQFIDTTVDFAASDVAMTDAEIAEVARGVVMIPMTAGSIAVGYNLPGIPSGLKLSRSVLVDIFRGRITAWRDPQILALNPDLDLPDLPIEVCHRSDGSGTTDTFTRHLAAIDPTWESEIGVGMSLEWPVGIGVKGNEGMSAQMLLSEGVIGYVESVYARDLDLSVAALENRSGQFILPTPTSSALALQEIELPENLRAFIPDPAGTEAYPIVTYTWILAYRQYPDPDMAAALREVLSWALTHGQTLAEELGYLPLSETVVARSLEAVQLIQS
ncbi:phosphate ABC transporter substrate-binding protein PstS [Thermostichus vulcanus]|uniref:Phosphate-binding protein n=1 Tax=Thermostichus vulcanus str. 'Rupite' TaxID=2813851 RepID=A0ABT0CEJ0_THEVL|nr:phosphate ABC transporter substrate-binding protein PstS [Thermostichus vulcanus]MCJ2544196.1 phosphate ABC transporter substrate-binding protein PstS [Thermostichus vulcanus str. 'Rupite']